MGDSGKRVGGHSGMENTDAPSIIKVVAVAASTLKSEKALLLLLKVPRPSHSLYFAIDGVLANEAPSSIIKS